MVLVCAGRTPRLECLEVGCDCIAAHQLALQFTLEVCMLMHDVMQHVGHLIDLKIKHTHAQVVLMRGEFRLGGGVGGA